MTDETESDSRWHLDKRVPIALILAIFLQTFGFGWWAASVTERVTALENRQMERAMQAERLASLEATMQAVKDDLRDIKAILQGTYTQRRGR